MSEASTEPPKVGSQIAVQIIQAANRPTIIAENGIVATVNPAELEVIFLRTELTSPIQHGIVQQDEAGNLNVEISNAPIVHQLTDIGHVRLAVPKAFELSVNILKHCAQHHGVAPDEILEKLTSALGVAK